MSIADQLNFLAILLIGMAIIVGFGICLLVLSTCISASCADRHGWKTWEDLDSYARDCEARWEAEGNSAKLHKDNQDETTKN